MTMKIVFLLLLCLITASNAQLISNILTIITSLINISLFNPGLLNLNIFSLLNITEFANNLPAVFTAINNGVTPQWILNNTLNHAKLVAPIVVKPSYDFIVVGAGSAGSVVASRLSENPNVTVLLIEYGGAETILNDVPLFTPIIAALPDLFEWGFKTVPQNNTLLNMDGQQCPWKRGKGMGGTSSINAMMFVRGNHKDIDNWAVVTGDNAWNYSNLLPYFKRYEHNYDPAFVANGYHGVSGPFPVDSHWKTDTNPSEGRIIRAAQEFGANQIDFNGPTQIGGNVAQQNILNGNRISASKAFLEPVYPNRSNLKILALNLVTRVLFSGQTAIGVEYKSNPLDKPHTVLANKEVILCAGAIKTPHILLQSGIGPANDLNQLGINVIANLSGVGENLQDHVNTIGIGYSVPSIGTPPLSLGAILSYVTTRTGPLAYLYDWQGYGGNFSSSVNSDPSWPDQQINGIGFVSGFEPTGVLLNLLFGLKLDVFATMFAPHFNQPSFLMWADLERPKSRGRIWIDSTDPFAHPLIDPKYYSHPDDMRTMIDGNRWLYCFEHTNEFRNWGAKKFPELVVGCEDQWSLVSHPSCPQGLVPNDTYLECHARHMTTTAWHFSSTAKMGAVDDPMAVVDTQLRVLNVNNLRVIDASVMPVITNGNIYAAVMAIAEKGAQMIKDFYGI